MKTFSLLLLLSCIAMSLASAPLIQARRLEISQYQARRLLLPGPVKSALKVAKDVIVTGAIDCLFGAFVGQLTKIPFLKNLPAAQTAGKAKDKLNCTCFLTLI